MALSGAHAAAARAVGRELGGEVIGKERDGGARRARPAVEGAADAEGHALGPGVRARRDVDARRIDRGTVRSRSRSARCPGCKTRSSGTPCRR